MALLAEIALRLMGKYAVYTEKTQGTYAIGYGETRNSWYYTHSPNLTDTPQNGDFNYALITNSLGLREKEVLAKDTGKQRIIVFGDSFAEGVGAPYDSTWPRITEKLLNESGIRAEVINAGIGGSDVFYQYVLYRDKLQPLQPDVVIVSINASDYTDYIFRGGMERFLNDSTTRNRPAPWYEPVYHYSHLFRGVLHKVKGFNINGMFVSVDDYEGIFKEANAEFIMLLKQFNALAEEHNSVLCVVIHNTPVEIIWPVDVNVASVVCLQQLHSGLKAAGVQAINVSDAVIAHYKNKAPESYSYINDRHYKPVGYYYLAQQITDSLLVNGIVK